MRAIQRRNPTTTSWRRSRQFLGFGALMRSSWSYCHAICFGVLVKRVSLALALIVCICVIGIIDAWVRFRDAVQGWDFCGIRSRESLETSIIFFIVLEWKTSSLRYFMLLISSSSSYSLPLFAPQWGTYSSFFIKALYDCIVDAGGVC